MDGMTSQTLSIVSILLFFFTQSNAFSNGRALPQANSGDSLFKEYMSRGLFSCTAEYMQIIAEIQRLTQRAGELSAKCEEELAEQSKTFPRTNFSPFDELMEEWSKEEGERMTAADSSSKEEGERKAAADSSLFSLESPSQFSNFSPTTSPLLEDNQR